MRCEIQNRKSDVAGIMLFECLVYISVLMILMGLGFAAFYTCWDKSKSLRHHADSITSAMHAGERWRKDIRGASGRITVEQTSSGQRLRIPRGKDAVLYEFADGQLRRKSASASAWSTTLNRVKLSNMTPEPRGKITAWRWDLELVPYRPQVRIPPVFTFEAVPPTSQ